MFCPEFQCQHSKNTTSASYIKNLRLLRHVLSDLPDTKLGCLMHSCSKCRTRINMDDHFILIGRLYILPGRDDEDIIHIELMKILLPVIDPVHILRLGFFNRAFTDVHISRHLF